MIFGSCLIHGKITSVFLGQVIRVNSERVTVPEILFRPSDVGLEQIGIAEAINYVIGLTDPGTYPLSLRY